MALAPAGGWAPGDASYRRLLEDQRAMPLQAVQTAAPHAGAVAAGAEGRRRATEPIVENGERLPPEWLGWWWFACRRLG